MNIGYFGGDSRKVTVWGQSSGGLTAGLLMLSPLSNGLMSSVIMSSSPLPMAAWNCNQTEAVTVRWMQQTKCASDWNSACLNNLTLSEVFDAVKSSGQSVLLGPPDWISNFSPCVDGTLIDLPPLAKILQGNFTRIPVLAGFTSNEANLFTQSSEKLISSYTNDDFFRYINKCAHNIRLIFSNVCDRTLLRLPDLHLYQTYIFVTILASARS
jgi:carboxylesterase type B